MRGYPLSILRLLEGEEGGGKIAEESSTEQQKEQQSFTQADVDRVVAERVKRERAKFADYADLKAKAEQSKTLEDRLADVEKRAATAEANALRSDIAAEFGISAEDRDLFLTGVDEDTLKAQAKRLAEREEDRKKRGNVAPKEGKAADTQGGSNELRGIAEHLFGTPD